MYYKGWMHEVLYDVNHNHFYRALRKTNLMHNDMRKRHAEKEYYNATHLRGIIYSLMGNMEMARQMGGDVILDTSYKEGSRFILKLPVA